jgi:predicted GH43/DUF377 family glycosyl hydrolase
MSIDPREMFQRSPDNPILTTADVPQMVSAICNPGVARVGDTTVLLARVEDRTGLSRLIVATKADKDTDWLIEPDRGMDPDPDRPEERWGIEDPRISQIGDDYYIAYTGVSVGGPQVCLAVTQDFERFDRLGPIAGPEDRDAALLPATFGGKFALLHRPTPIETDEVGTHIWLSWSKDLRAWGGHQVLLAARHRQWWDAKRIGVGPPPLLTKAGWLVCYRTGGHHGSGPVSRLGLALLDRHNPSVVLARGNEWVFAANAPYERKGDAADVVSPCGWYLEGDRDTLVMYYGGGDSNICVASASLADLLSYLNRHPCNGQSHREMVGTS